MWVEPIEVAYSSSVLKLKTYYINSNDFPEGVCFTNEVGGEHGGGDSTVVGAMEGELDGWN